MIRKPLTEKEQELWDLRRISHKPEDCPKVLELLQKKSDEQLFELLERIMLDNPFTYRNVIEYIIGKLYADNDKFIDLLCKLIEIVSRDMACGNIVAPIEDYAVKQPEVTIAISNKMLKKGVRPGICSGYVISPLLGKGIVDEEILAHLRSDDSLLKRRALVGLCNSFIRRDQATAKLFIPTLLEIAGNVNEEDSNILIHTLAIASRMNGAAVLPILSQQIDVRGYVAAITFANAELYRPDTSMELLEKSVEIIESESHDFQVIDQILGKIYEKNPDFVIERLRARLHENSFPITNDTMLEHYISQNPEPVVKMMEEEIDKENQMMLGVGDHLLEVMYHSNEKSFEWCKKWKDDARKETIVIKSLARILADLRDHKPSEVVDGSILILKEIAEKKEINIDKVTKNIRLKKGEEYKESILKSLHIVNLMLSPPQKIDKAILARVLNRYPYICKAIEEEWLINSIDTEFPHIFAYIYGWELNTAEQEELAKRFDVEKDPMNKAWIAEFYHSKLRHLENQKYWDNVFKTLFDFNIPIKRHELKNNENSYLAEAEVAARLAPHFEKVLVKPTIAGFETLDLQIEHDGQIALIEVRTIEQDVENRVAATHGVISSIPGGKVKNALMTKFKKQLKNGELDPGVPVIIVLNAEHTFDQFEIENAVYGQFQFSFTRNNETDEIVSQGSNRAVDNAFFKIEKTDIITAIAAYHRDHTRKDALVGRFYPPFASTAPKNKMTRAFRLRLRNALFGESETSNWKSLMKVEGIDEALAKKFYDNGIEDLGDLASFNEADYIIDGVNTEQLTIFKKEANRVIAAHQFGSIKYLRGIDKPTYDLLTSQGIHLTENLLKIQKPQEVAQQIWDTMIQDAKRIYAKDTD